jgi:hypothetical protein
MTVTPVERFLARPGTMVPVDDDGFLSAEFVERASEPRAKSSGIRTWEELDHEPCVMLLGEPGSGKTRVFEEAHAQPMPPIAARRVDLGRFGTAEHLKRGLAFPKWLNSKGDVERQGKVVAQLDFSRHLEQPTRDCFQQLALSATMGAS